MVVSGGASSRSCRPACRRSSRSAGPPRWPRRSATPGRCSRSAAGRRCCPWDPRLSWSRSGRRCPARRTDRRHVLLRYRSLEKPYTERRWRSAPAPPLRPRGVRADRAGGPREDTRPGQQARARAADVPRVRRRHARGPGRAGPRPDPAAAADGRPAAGRGRLHGPDAVLLPGGGLRAEGAGHHAGQPGHRQGRAPGRRAAVRRAHRGAAGADQRVRHHRGQDRRRLRGGDGPAGQAGSGRTGRHRHRRAGPGARARHRRDPAADRDPAGRARPGQDPRGGGRAEPASSACRSPRTTQVPAAVAGADIVVTATTSPEPGAAPRVAGPGRARERGRRLRARRPGARHRDHGRGGRFRGQPRVGQPRGWRLPAGAGGRA